MCNNFIFMNIYEVIKTPTERTQVYAYGLRCDIVKINYHQRSWRFSVSFLAFNRHHLFININMFQLMNFMQIICLEKRTIHGSCMIVALMCTIVFPAFEYMLMLCNKSGDCYDNQIYDITFSVINNMRQFNCYVLFPGNLFMVIFLCHDALDETLEMFLPKYINVR